MTKETINIIEDNVGPNAENVGGGRLIKKPERQATIVDSRNYGRDDSDRLTDINSVTHKLEYNNVLVDVDFHGPLTDGRREYMEKYVSERGRFWDDENLHYVNTINNGKLPKGDYIDGGGNIGNNTVFYLRFDRSCQRVLFVEPFLPSFKIAEKNFERYDPDGTRVIKVLGALGSENGKTVKLFNTFGDNLSTVKTDSRSGAVGENGILGEAIVRTIDDLVEEFELQPIFIKLDVEDAEYDALLGAIQTIRKFRPLIYTEIWPDNTGAFAKIKNLLQAEGYAKGWRWNIEHYYWYDPKRPDGYRG